MRRSSAIGRRSRGRGTRRLDLTRLLAERDRLVRRMLRDVRESHPLAGHHTGSDPAERVQADLQHEVDVGVLVHEAEARARIQDALRRPASRRGVCARCGGAIGSARLRAVPFTDLCRRCKEREEARGTAAERSTALVAG